VEAGKFWSERWQEVGPLGGGGQGDTFIVQSIASGGKQAVLKVLRSSKEKDSKARRRMSQEVNNLRILHNAGGKVPGVLESNIENFEALNLPLYLVMEYVAGPTLAETLKQRKSLPVEIGVGIALDLCRTVRIAVAERIAHRDVKPENIIVRSLEPPDVVMVDFGLSFNENDTADLTETEETLDNKFLSLPERRGPGEDKRDFRSDVTGICAILFYCLTGCSPRNLRDSQGRSPHRSPSYSLEGRIKNGRQLAALNLLLDRGLAYEIDSRFQTIDELTGRLGEVLAPDFRSPPEDFDKAIARHAAALRKNDRKTQLADCRTKAMILTQSINQCVSDIQNRARNHTAFAISWPSMVMGSNGKCVFGDEVAYFDIFIVFAVHGRQCSAHYTIASKGMECEIYREIRYQHPAGRVETIDAPLMVTRYSGEESPDAAAVVADIKPAVLRAIEVLSAKIQEVSE